MPTLIQFLAWPGGPGAQLTFDTPVAKATSAAWLTGFASVAFKLLWSVAVIGNKLSGGPRGSPAGSGVLCACGGLGMAMNAWMIHEKRNSATSPTASEWIIAIAVPISPLFKPAKHVIPPPYKLPVIGIADLVSDLGAGIVKMVRGNEIIDSETAERPAPVLR